MSDEIYHGSSIYFLKCFNDNTVISVSINTIIIHDLKTGKLLYHSLTGQSFTNCIELHNGNFIVEGYYGFHELWRKYYENDKLVIEKTPIENALEITNNYSFFKYTTEYKPNNILFTNKNKILSAEIKFDKHTKIIPGPFQKEFSERINYISQLESNDIIISTTSKDLYVFDIVTWNQKFKVSIGEIGSLRLFGNKLIINSINAINFWNTDTFEKITTLKCYFPRFSPYLILNNKLIILNNGILYIYDLRTYRKIIEHNVKTRTMAKCNLHYDCLLVTSGETFIKHFDI